MKYAFLILLNLTAFLVAGCNTTPTKVDRGPIHATTFSFVARSGSLPKPGFTDRRDAVHVMIHDAISRNLSSKGVNQVASGGDVIVAYLLIVGNNSVTESITTYFGNGRNVADLHGKAHEVYTGNESPNYWEAGTLLIDIIDAKTFKLLKRAYVTRALLRDASADIRVAQIEEAVDAVLNDVRIAQ